MRLLAISDLHGDLDSARRAIEVFGPDLVLSCGDWGDPDQVSEADLAAFADLAPVLSTFGNHDPLDALARVRNRDGSAVLIAQGEVREVGGVRIAAIGGIWAKSNRLPHYVTDAQVADAAGRIARLGSTDILLTHGCPAGLADLTAKGAHGGQRCFLEAFHEVAPRVHLCGHLHVAQERALKDGRKVVNVGATPEGTAVLIEHDAGVIKARIERFSTE